MIEKLFVLLNDITDKETGDIVERIGVESTKQYKTKPEECPSCGKKAIAGLEIIGTHDSSILWQCVKCGDRFLKLGRTKPNLPPAPAPNNAVSIPPPGIILPNIAPPCASLPSHLDKYVAVRS